MRVIYKYKHCENCDAKMRAQLVRNITKNGVSQVYWLCLTGNHMICKQPQFIAHEILRKYNVDIDELPVINNYSGTELCAVCNSPFAEEHHWAPKHLFGDEANLWPTSHLCKKHHEYWHKIVTPEMTRRNERI